MGSGEDFSRTLSHTRSHFDRTRNLKRQNTPPWLREQASPLSSTPREFLKITAAVIAFCLITFVITNPISTSVPLVPDSHGLLPAYLHSPTPPTIAGPHAAFLLRVQSDHPEIDGSYVNACGGFYWIGRETCAICPSSAGAACADVLNKTVLTGNGQAMNLIPGGQSSFLASTTDGLGAFAYTTPHSIVLPAATQSSFSIRKTRVHPLARSSQLSLAPLFAHSNGNTRWSACLVADPSSANYGEGARGGQRTRAERAVTESVWQVFAQVEGMKRSSTCVPMRIEVQGVGKGMFGAYQF